MNDEFPDRRRPDLAGLGACAATSVDPFPTPIESHSTGQESGSVGTGVGNGKPAQVPSAVRVVARRAAFDFPDDTWGARVARVNRMDANRLSPAERETLLAWAIQTINGEAKP